VADTLVISIRTVESHLSHVYRKLEVRSRTELARKIS
jgi:DNA-binding NarL/FixJ family response regulator